jgi:hypothetical protein
MSDIDSDNCRAARGGNVYSMGDLDSNKRKNESMPNSEQLQFDESDGEEELR